MPATRESFQKSARLKAVLNGLTPEQKAAVRAALPEWSPDHRTPRTTGWSLYREPTTIHPPRVLRLIRRDAEGKILQTVSITERSSASQASGEGTS